MYGRGSGYKQDAAESLSLLSNYTSHTTVSNLPGTGRTVGRLWMLLSSWTEKQFVKLAHKKGLGADTVAERLSTEIQEQLKTKCEWSLNDEDLDALVSVTARSDCFRLAKYASSRSSPTESLALSHIIGLSTMRPSLRNQFSGSSIVETIKAILQADPDKISYEIQDRRDMSSRALSCLEDNDVTRITKDMQGPYGLNQDGRGTYRNAILNLLNFSTKSGLLHAGIRYADALLEHTFLCTEKHIQVTDDFLSRICQNLVDLLLPDAYDTKDDSLDGLCASVLKLVKGRDVPRNEGHPILNFVTILNSPSSKDEYPRAHALLSKEDSDGNSHTSTVEDEAYESSGR